jgi:hypothetical protein
MLSKAKASLRRRSAVPPPEEVTEGDASEEQEQEQELFIHSWLQAAGTLEQGEPPRLVILTELQW